MCIMIGVVAEPFCVKRCASKKIKGQQTLVLNVGNMQRDILANDVLDVGRNTLEKGSLVSGSFKEFGGYWFSITLWCTIGCGLVYLAGGFVAVVINKKYKKASFAFVPAITALYGMLVGFIVGGLAGFPIAAMYRTGPYYMQWYISAVWGLGLSVFHLIASFARGILR